MPHAGKKLSKNWPRFVGFLASALDTISPYGQVLVLTAEYPSPLAFSKVKLPRHSIYS
jgi:hypothetical protein